MGPPPGLAAGTGGVGPEAMLLAPGMRARERRESRVRNGVDLFSISARGRTKPRFPLFVGPPRPHPCAAIAGILPQPAPLPSPPPSSAVGSQSIPIRGDALRDDALQHLRPHGGAPPFSGLRGADGEAEAVPGAEADGRAAGFDLMRLPEGFPRRTRRQTEVFDGGFAPWVGRTPPSLPPPPPVAVDALRVGGAVCERWLELRTRRWKLRTAGSLRAAECVCPPVPGGELRH